MKKTGGNDNLTKNDLEDMATLLWECHQYLQSVGLGNAGYLSMKIEKKLGKYFIYDLKNNRFILKKIK